MLVHISVIVFSREYTVNDAKVSKNRLWKILRCFYLVKKYPALVI